MTKPCDVPSRTIQIEPLDMVTVRLLMPDGEERTVNAIACRYTPSVRRAREIEVELILDPVNQEPTASYVAPTDRLDVHRLPAVSLLYVRPYVTEVPPLDKQPEGGGGSSQ